MRRDRRLRPSVRRILLRHAVFTLLVAAVLSSLTLLGATTVAEDEARRTAQRVSGQVATALAVPLSEPDYRTPETGRRNAVLADLRPFLSAGIVARVKVWIVDGEVARIVLSDEPRIEGTVRPFDPELARRLDLGEIVTMALPRDDEHRYELAAGENLVEAFLGFTDGAGNRMLLEIYVPVDVAASSEHSVAALLPVLLAGLLGFAIVTIPLSVRLARRMERDHQERQDALRYGLAASDHERRELAQQLHDGVIQDLAGTGMLLDAMRLAEREHPLAETRGALLEEAQRLVESDVLQLRDLATELLPAAAGEDIHTAFADLVTRLRPHGDAPRIDLGITVDPRVRLDPAAVQLVYRAARELLRNALRHSRATRVELRLAADDHTITLTVADDGIGFDTDHASTPGHIGLTLVRRVVEEAGGDLSLTSARGTGTTVTVSVPNSRE